MAMRMICHGSVMHAVCECDTSWARGTSHLTRFCVLSVKAGHNI